MRRILAGDVSAAARALLNVPPVLREDLCRRLIREADAAHRYFKKHGRSHLLWGNGSLMSAARKRPLTPEPSFSDIEYCSCTEMVLRELSRWRLSRAP